jgi:hypothetical protein
MQLDTTLTTEQLNGCCRNLDGIEPRIDARALQPCL